MPNLQPWRIMMEFTIDRFEGRFAICEGQNGEIFNIPSTVLNEAHEGDIIHLVIDRNKTKEKKKINQERLNKLFNGGK